MTKVRLREPGWKCFCGGPARQTIQTARREMSVCNDLSCLLSVLLMEDVLPVTWQGNHVDERRFHYEKFVKKALNPPGV